MKKIILFLNGKDFKKGAITCLALLLVITLVGCGKKNKLKSTEFEALVNTELDLNASTYFDTKNKNDKISVKNSSLDIKTVGTYDLNIMYGKKVYDIKVKVVDKEKPVLRVKKSIYTFDLKATAKTINETINKDIMITDNYDTKFGDIEIIKDIPKEEKEVVVKLTVEDTSKNKSDEVEIKIQFTKDGKEKKNLKQEEKSATTKGEEKKKEVASTNGGNSTSNKTPTKEESKGDLPSNSKPNNGGGTTTPPPSKPTPPVNKPTEPSKPTPPVNKPTEPSKPTPPVNKPTEPSKPTPPPVTPSKPKLTVDNFPNYLLGNSGRVFATEDEAYAWANSQVTKEGSPWFGYTMMLGQPFDGDYSNSGGGDCPWTVSFWMV